MCTGTIKVERSVYDERQSNLGKDVPLERCRKHFIRSCPICLFVQLRCFMYPHAVTAATVTGKEAVEGLEYGRRVHAGDPFTACVCKVQEHRYSRTSCTHRSPFAAVADLRACRGFARTKALPLKLHSNAPEPLACMHYSASLVMPRLHTRLCHSYQLLHRKRGLPVSFRPHHVPCWDTDMTSKHARMLATKAKPTTGQYHRL